MIEWLFWLSIIILWWLGSLGIMEELIFTKPIVLPKLPTLSKPRKHTELPEMFRRVPEFLLKESYVFPTPKPPKPKITTVKPIHKPKNLSHFG